VISGLVLEVGLIVALAAAWVDFGLDARIVAFTIALAALATVVDGLVSALRLLRLATVFPWRLGVGNPLLLAAVAAIRWPAGTGGLPLAADIGILRLTRTRSMT
jgi:hypothetical protein